MTTMTRAWLFGLLVLSACGAKSTPQIGGETNWLEICERDAQCGAGGCVCGVCSIECSENDDCTGGFRGACVSARGAVGSELCVAQSEPVPAAGLCLPRCEADRECGTGYRCEQATCVPRREPSSVPRSDAGRDAEVVVVTPDAQIVVPAIDAGPRDAEAIPLDAEAVQLPTFTARLSGTQIWLDAQSDRPLFLSSCADEVVLEKRSGDGWTAPRDDRPPSTEHPGYYLDGVFEPPNMNNGCDISGCYELDESIPVGLAIEYEQVGTMAPPPGSRSPAELVAVIVSHPLEGDLRVRVRYSMTDRLEVRRCADEIETTAELTLAEGSVCCCGQCPDEADADAGL